MEVATRLFQEFTSLYDPVHGQIDLSDSVTNHNFGGIRRILSSPMLDRLRRIKQLGFASYTYLSADHSRYAHALGTMQVMRAILRRLDQLEDQSSQTFFPLEELRSNFQFSEIAGMDDETLRLYLKQHTLAAALLQDVGELPYETATARIFSPDSDTRNRVKQLVGLEVDTWESKHVFTLASLIEEENQEYLEGFNVQLLAFLIAGQNYPIVTTANGLQAWLQMLNGEVDADRLDYVYRDAHHTVGGRGTPLAVVNSLLSYDTKGPIFSEIGPITDFISTRGHLWTTVYLEAQNRFRRMLLLILLREILNNDKHNTEFVKAGIVPSLGMHGFKQLDDFWLWGRLREVYKSGSLGYHTQRALEILMNERDDYGFVWIRPQSPNTPTEENVVIPDGLFFDTYSELYRHWLCEPGSIRIEAKSFRYLGSPLPLEECSSLGEAFTRDVAPQPVPNAIQVFLPARRQGAAWKKVEELLASGSLHSILKKNDPLHALEIPVDTRNEKGFRPPAIFVSFRWSDVDYVDEVLRALYRDKRQYFALRGKHTGVGSTTEENSRNAVRDAEAVLIVASVQYAEQYGSLPNGNIHHEISEITKRRDPNQGKPIPLALISVDPWNEIEHSLPWSDLGLPKVPFVGSPLKSMSQRDIADLAREAVRSIDGQYSK
jgi:HD superfamily phosphohydrolase